MLQGNLTQDDVMLYYTTVTLLSVYVSDGRTRASVVDVDDSVCVF